MPEARASRSTPVHIHTVAKYTCTLPSHVYEMIFTSFTTSSVPLPPRPCMLHTWPSTQSHCPQPFPYASPSRAASHSSISRHMHFAQSPPPPPRIRAKSSPPPTACPLPPATPLRRSQASQGMPSAPPSSSSSSAAEEALLIAASAEKQPIPAVPPTAAARCARLDLANAESGATSIATCFQSIAGARSTTVSRTTKLSRYWGRGGRRTRMSTLVFVQRTPEQNAGTIFRTEPTSLGQQYSVPHLVAAAGVMIRSRWKLKRKAVKR